MQLRQNICFTILLSLLLSSVTGREKSDLNSEIKVKTDEMPFLNEEKAFSSS